MNKSYRRTFIALINLILIIIAIFVVKHKIEARETMNALSCITYVEAQSPSPALKVVSDNSYHGSTNNNLLAPAPIDTPTIDEDFDDESDMYYHMTEDDVYELATLVYLESHTESYECKCAVASVVLNRMTTRNMTLQEVIYEQNQFSPAYLIPYTVPTDEELNAVREIITNGPTIPEYVTFFRADYYFSWVEPYTYIDHTYFSYDDSVRAQVGE